MNIAVGISCLVAVAVLEGVTGVPEQQPHLDDLVEDNGMNFDLLDDLHQRQDLSDPFTKKKCKDAGGECKLKTGPCDGAFRYGHRYCRDAKDYGCCVSPECVHNNKAYPIGSTAVISCFLMDCSAGGEWIYTGKIDTTCGECQAYGDPQFITFDGHSPSGWSGYPRWYTYNGVGEFVITQTELGDNPDIYVTSNFEEEPGWGYSAARSVCYFEPDTKFCAYLPSLNLNQCYDTSDPTIYPECAIKVTVGGSEEVITDTVSMFNTWNGNVLVFKHNHTSILPDPYHGIWYNNASMNTECINIVGSTGLSMSLCTSNSGAGSAYSLYSHLYVWAMPHLRGTPSKLYGLCDTFTGQLRPGYTMSNGTLTSKITYDRYEHGIDGTPVEFVDSWKVGGPDQAVANNQQPILDRYDNQTIKEEIEAICDDIFYGCQIILPAWICDTLNASCIYDLCHVSNPDSYAQGYYNHLLIENNLHQ